MRTVDTGRAAAGALERRQRDFRADITRRPVRLPSLHAGSGGGLEPFRCGGASCPMHQRSPRFGALFCGAPASPLGRQHLEHVTVRIAKVKTASAATVIDLHIVERAGAAAISNALGADAIEDAVKLGLVDFEGIVVTL